MLPALVVCSASSAAHDRRRRGFSVGFLLDCLLIAPLGGGSLVLLSTGYLAGLFRERFEINSPLMPPLLCMGLTLFAELGFGAVELMLGLDAPISTLVVRDMLIKSVFAFFLGWPIYLGISGAAAGAGRGAGAAPGARRRRCGSLGADVIPPRRAVPRANAWRCGSRARRRRRRALRDPLLPALEPAGARRRQLPGRGQNNRTREYKVIAPRGDILYRNGEVLVDNRTSLALLLTSDKLPEDAPSRRPS